MSLPNKLTICRVFLSIIFITFFLSDGIVPNNYVIAFIVFAIAALTDFLDGFIARRNNRKMETVFGIVFDPIADRVLISSALILFVYSNALHPLVDIVLISRDILMCGIRILLSYQKQVLFPASILGKIKMVFEVILVFSLFVNYFFGIEKIVLLSVSVVTIFFALLSFVQLLLEYGNDIFHEIYTKDMEVK
jgi:CDP-diacylglycerol--glycerol-3-phosphate 3-phosphatidyltransferase